jgi:hypothetical protein
MDYAEMAERLGRTRCAVKTRCAKRGLVTRTQATAAEIEYVKLHRDDSCVAVAAALGRPRLTIYNLRNRLGITKKMLAFGKPFEKFLRAKHAAGWSDSEIGQAWGCERHTVGDWRHRLNLPDNTLSEHRRQRVADKTRQQCQAAGVKSLAEVRAKAFRDYAKQYGWPEDLIPREVQILNALMRNGPQTRRQLADAIGVKWKGSRKSLVSPKRPGGSYLAHLMKRGLVVTLGRVVKGKGRGKSCQLYSIPLWTERQVG